MRGGPIVTKRTQELRGLATDAEKWLWLRLRSDQIGARFRRQHPIPPYIADFACVSAKLIVEVDGGQHAEPGEHDRRDAFLQERGWQVLRFWNNDVLNNIDGVLQVILDALKKSPPSHAGEG